MALSDIRAAKVKEQSGDHQTDAELHGFFRVKTDADGNFKNVDILQTGFLKMLREMGFRRYDVQDTFIIVRIQDNIIEEIFIHVLREIVVKHVHTMDDYLLDENGKGCERDILLEKLHRSLNTLTSPEKMALLVDLDGDEEIKIIEDERDKAYYFYKNGFIIVTKDGVKLKPYNELPGHVWKDQILQREYKAMAITKFMDGTYARFCLNVCGNDTKRLDSFVTITGYCLHRFFKTKLKSVIFLDGRNSDDPDGRSGKSLHTKAMQQILNASENGKQAIIIDGKRYDESNRFAFDELHVSTKICVFDDLKRGFHIETFFNAIVDGILRERKGDINKIRVQCKIIFTLNYTISIRGGSAKDRVVEFEFADHYSSAFSPEMEFKHWFFRDWGTPGWENEWHYFDNFMMYCVQQYLGHGIINPNTINLEARKLKDETNQEFINFMEDLAIQHEQRFSKKELYMKFAEIGESGKTRVKDYEYLKQKTFTKYLKYWSEYRPEIAGHIETRSDSVDYITYFLNEPMSKYFPPDKCVLHPGKSTKVTFVKEEESQIKV